MILYIPSNTIPEDWFYALNAVLFIALFLALFLTLFLVVLENKKVKQENENLELENEKVKQENEKVKQENKKLELENKEINLRLDNSWKWSWCLQNTIDHLKDNVEELEKELTEIESDPVDGVPSAPCFWLLRGVVLDTANGLEKTVLGKRFLNAATAVLDTPAGAPPPPPPPPPRA
jgi:predicted nuclease with TOPRIM domain